MRRNAILILVVLIGTASHLVAQDSLKATLAADVVNQYVWRGLELGHASLQPTLALGWRGLSLSAWGTVGISDAKDTREIDLTAAYATDGLSVGIVDYWSDTPDKRYFLYDAHRTSHVFEGFVAYDFGVCSLSWQTIFAGNDGLDSKGRRAYSSYAEACVPFRLAECDWQATVGVVPHGTGYYETRGFAVTNLSLKAVKSVKLSNHFSVPVFAQIVGNPCSQHAYLVFGLTLSTE